MKNKINKRIDAMNNSIRSAMVDAVNKLQKNMPYKIQSVEYDKDTLKITFQDKWTGDKCE